MIIVQGKIENWRIEMIKMSLALVVPFDEEVETLAEVCDEITEGTGLTWEYVDDATYEIRFIGTRDQILTFLGQYEPDAY
jgi:hypothetical protein